jgi:hypothetical protein
VTSELANLASLVAPVICQKATSSLTDTLISISSHWAFNLLLALYIEAQKTLKRPQIDEVLVTDALN